MPDALELKYAERECLVAMQWVFAAAQRSIDPPERGRAPASPRCADQPESGVPFRRHSHEFGSMLGLESRGSLGSFGARGQTLTPSPRERCPIARSRGVGARVGVHAQLGDTGREPLLYCAPRSHAFGARFAPVKLEPLARRNAHYSVTTRLL